jgi:asparagine synthase (glutamine-hydrolysing)
MLLFLAATDISAAVRGRAGAALRSAASFVAGLDLERIERHESPSGRTLVLALGHPPSAVVPRRYLWATGRELVLFDGLPLTDDGELVLDAERLGQGWNGGPRIDGAGVALRADLERERVELVTPPLGLVQVFACEAPGGGRLLSNSALALRLLAGLEEPDPLGVSSLLALGWTVGDRTLTAGIAAVPGGSRVTLADGRMHVEPRLAPAQLAEAEGAAPAELVERLVESARGLAALGGAVRCPLTAGRDSRLCLALLRAAGVDADCYTGVSTGEIDVRVASDLAASFDLRHSVELHEDLWEADGEALARGFVFQNDGLSSFEQIADHPQQLAPAGTLGVKVSGLGGEIARAGAAPIMGPAAAAWPFALLPRLQRRMLALKAHAPAGVVRPAAVARTKRHLREFVDERVAEGWPPEAVGQTFYAFERVTRWAATGVRRTAATADLFSPFFSRHFLAAALSQPGRDWVAERLHHRLMGELEPALRDAPYSEPWPPQRRGMEAPFALAGSARAVASGVGALVAGGRGLRPDTEGSLAGHWAARTGAVHAEVVRRARGSALEDYIDLDTLERELSAGAPADNATLRALTAVWWFAGLDSSAA